MKLTVFGATGRIGGEAVRQALDLGDEVTAVLRHGTELDITHPHLRIVRVPGLTEAGPLLEALEGSDAALSGIGPRARQDTRVASTATRGILRALQLTAVRRFAAVSAAPVAPPAEGDSFFNKRIIFPLMGGMLREIYADLSVMEREIMESGIDWTIVRPPKLVDRPVSGVYRTVIGGNVPRGITISRADCAHLMLRALRDPAMRGHAVGIAY
jgi:uncharacterized protein YbjT (DUF2867 family)